MKNRGENYQSACFVYKGQCFWYFQTKRHCFTQTNPEINGNFKGKESICSVQLAGIFTIHFTTHFTYSIFLSATTELVYTGPWRVLEDVHASDTEGMWWCCPQSHSNQLQSNLRPRLLLLYIKDKFNKRPKMAKSSSLTPYKAPSLTTELLDATICMPVWDTPTLWCFHPSVCMEAPCCSKRDKKQGRKISLATFQLLYDSNSFLSPAAQRCQPDLFAQGAESIWITLLRSACWSLSALISLII